MPLHVALLRERLGALRAAPLPLVVCAGPLVGAQVRPVREALLARGALERPLAGVEAHVPLEHPRPLEPLPALGALVAGGAAEERGPRCRCLLRTQVVARVVQVLRATQHALTPPAIPVL